MEKTKSRHTLGYCLSILHTKLADSSQKATVLHRQRLDDLKLESQSIFENLFWELIRGGKLTYIIPISKAQGAAKGQRPSYARPNTK